MQGGWVPSFYLDYNILMVRVENIWRNDDFRGTKINTGYFLIFKSRSKKDETRRVKKLSWKRVHCVLCFSLVTLLENPFLIINIDTEMHCYYHFHDYHVGSDWSGKEARVEWFTKDSLVNNKKRRFSKDIVHYIYHRDKKMQRVTRVGTTGGYCVVGGFCGTNG